MDKVELLILKNLIYNDEYIRKILPYLKSDYFQDYSQKIVFEEIQDFFSSYNKLPTKEALEIAKELGDWIQFGLCLGNLGIFHWTLVHIVIQSELFPPSL